MTADKRRDVEKEREKGKNDYEFQGVTLKIPLTRTHKININNKYSEKHSINHQAILNLLL